ncbi:DUF5681 domain-containing protein [Henriciella sp.]|uniref:DUF5681 domain-containing protein n=1 Tax=Henriciella sp. TaxID=1968823 RepID=UPI00345C245F
MTKRRKSSKAPAGDVGYGRPPKNSQFKEGQSGNPKGRPRNKKETHLTAMVESAFMAPIPAQVGGKQVTMPAIEAMIMRLRNDALGGDLRSIAAAIKLFEAEAWMGRRRAHPLNASGKSNSSMKIWSARLQEPWGR